jgi:hypothetical protein
VKQPGNQKANKKRGWMNDTYHGGLTTVESKTAVSTRKSEGEQEERVDEWHLPWRINSRWIRDCYFDGLIPNSGEKESIAGDKKERLHGG